MNFLFVVLEGGDGVGKTTILPTKKDANIFVHQWPFSEIRRDVKNLSFPFARFLYYAASVAHVSALIQKILSEKPVICDRYIYHALVGFSSLSDRNIFDIALEYLAILSQLTTPTITVLLTTSKAEQQKRIQNRHTSTGYTDTLTLKDRSFTT